VISPYPLTSLPKQGELPPFAISMAVGAFSDHQRVKHSAARRSASIGSRRRLHRARHDSPIGPARPGVGTCSDAHLHARVSFPSPDEDGLLCGLLDFRHVFSSVLSDQREPRGLDGLIWPKDGCASIAWAATAAVRLSSPGLRPFLASQEKSHRRHPPLRSGPKGVRRRSPSACRSPSRPRWSRGSNTKGEVTWQASAPSRSPATSSRAKS
jgi:hypothetical protein